MSDSKPDAVKSVRVQISPKAHADVAELAYALVLETSPKG